MNRPIHIPLRNESSDRNFVVCGQCHQELTDGAAGTHVCEPREEDYPGQNDEIRRERLVRSAVEAADRILCDGADGSVEEINWLTSQVALRFAEKVNCAMAAALRAREIRERVKP